jgi:hypothetical protein
LHITSADLGKLNFQAFQFVWSSISGLLSWHKLKFKILWKWNFLIDYLLHSSILHTFAPCLDLASTNSKQQNRVKLLPMYFCKSKTAPHSIRFCMTTIVRAGQTQPNSVSNTCMFRFHVVNKFDSNLGVWNTPALQRCIPQMHTISTSGSMLICCLEWKVHELNANVQENSIESCMQSSA